MYHFAHFIILGWQAKVIDRFGRRIVSGHGSDGRESGVGLTQFGLIGSFATQRLGGLGDSREIKNSAAARRADTIDAASLKLEAKPFAQGGGGQVFKGKYLGQAIAAKKVFNVSEGDRSDFDTEVAMLSQLSHPCVLALFGVCQDDAGYLYMVRASLHITIF